MQAQKIREAFANYFIKNGHLKYKSSSLAPHNDPTILFANAGMNQFKDFFTGKANPEHRRAVTIQKCCRAGGKHNDLENVGFTARHHTFFEMLGNFSFGDYFKKDAINFAWKFLTEELKIPKEKLLVTVHESDDEALNIWHKDQGVPLDKIFKLGDKSNFWEMGDVGPCGPCTEIFYDHGPEFSTGVPAGHQEIDDEGRYVEIWNLVFMQFEKRYEGDKIVKINLPKPSVDTGAGLERVAAALQGKYYNYDSDIFTPIMNAIEKISGKKYSDPKAQSSFRVVADHIRACTMLITDGVIPSNEGRGYVLRRICRRAIRHLSLLGINEVSFYKLVPAVFESLGSEYPDNAANAALAEKLLKLEEEKFRKTLDTGLALIHDEMKKIAKGSKFSGEAAFKLYDTFGFPLDLTEVILKEHQIDLDSDGFNAAMAKQKEASKKSSKFKVQEDNAKVFYSIKEKFGDTKFVGYESIEAKAKLIDKVELGEITYLIFDKTPFYGESGGQVGDKGEIFTKEGKIADIDDTQKPVDGLFAHLSQNADSLVVGDEYILKVNSDLRERTKRNHSATHLLQSALIKVLGSHVKQAGSSVGPDRLRFDFTHPEAMKADEIVKVEALVNAAILKEMKVSADVMTKDQATQKGAMALFGEKYGDQVRVLTMGDFSCELCGGTHVSNTSEIGLFKILFETSLASGIRRIEAISSIGAIEYLDHRSQILSQVEKIFSVKEEKVLEKISQLQNDIKSKNETIDELNGKLQKHESEKLFNNQEKMKNDLSLCIAELAQVDPNTMRGLSDIYVDKYPKGILLLHGSDGDKSSFLIRTNKANTTINLSEITKKLMPIINGRGGGKPDMTQGSGDKDKFAQFVQEFKNALS